MIIPETLKIIGKYRSGGIKWPDVFMWTGCNNEGMVITGSTNTISKMGFIQDYWVGLYPSYTSGRISTMVKLSDDMTWIAVDTKFSALKVVDAENNYVGLYELATIHVPNGGDVQMMGHKVMILYTILVEGPQMTGGV